MKQSIKGLRANIEQLAGERERAENDSLEHTRRWQERVEELKSQGIQVRSKAMTAVFHTRILTVKFCCSRIDSSSSWSRAGLHRTGSSESGMEKKPKKNDRNKPKVVHVCWCIVAEASRVAYASAKKKEKKKKRNRKPASYTHPSNTRDQSNTHSLQS